MRMWTMDNSTPVFWIWIVVVVLFAGSRYRRIPFHQEGMASDHQTKRLNLRPKRRAPTGLASRSRSCRERRS